MRSRTVSRPAACVRSTFALAAHQSREFLAAPDLVNFRLPAHSVLVGPALVPAAGLQDQSAFPIKASQLKAGSPQKVAATSATFIVAAGN